MKDDDILQPVLHAAYRNASQITPRPLPWLWPNWIPSAALTLLVADPGVGKSLLCADLAARLSRAAPIDAADWLAAIEAIKQPDQPPPPSLAHITNLHTFPPNSFAPPALATAPWPDGTLNPSLYRRPPKTNFLASQECAEDALVGRLLAAGADLNHCRLIDGVSNQICMPPHHVPDPYQVKYLRLPSHLDALEDILGGASNTRLLIIDPLTDVLECPSAPATETLFALTALARRLDLAILATIHLNKSRHHRTLYRIRGSLDYIAVARSALLLSIDPRNPTRRTLHQIKNSYGPLSPPLSFTIAIPDPDSVPVSPRPFVPSPNQGAMPTRTTAPDGSDSQPPPPAAVRVGMHSRAGAAPALKWDDPAGGCAFSPELLDLPTEQQSAHLEARTWLLDQLADGPRLARELLSAASQCAISRNTLYRAKHELGVRSRKAALDRPYFWEAAPDRRAPGKSLDTQTGGCHETVSKGSNAH